MQLCERLSNKNKFGSPYQYNKKTQVLSIMKTLFKVWFQVGQGVVYLIFKELLNYLCIVISLGYE